MESGFCCHFQLQAVPVVFYAATEGKERKGKDWESGRTYKVLT